MSEPTKVEPLFLLSMPRSGSTLLQRILASHEQISTSPEPTFLLPLLHLDRSTDVMATFDQRYTAMAVQDFVTSLPGGRATYETELAGLATSLYHAAAGDGVRFHLDKTPKYHLIAHEIARMFPDAPIVVLWRNPLSVIASIMKTWGGGRWNLADFRIDIDEGLQTLVELVQQQPDRVIQVRYEDLVGTAEATIEAVFERLGLEPDQSVLERFGELGLEGRIQDPNVSTEAFKTMRSDRTEMWKEVLANPIRKRWAARYLRSLGRERLAVMGYDLDELLGEVEALKSTTAFLKSDLFAIPFDLASRLFEVQLFQHKFRSARSGRSLLAHK